MDTLPTITHYKYFLGQACTKFKITIDQARKKYGQYTYKQWNDLLK